MQNKASLLTAGIARLSWVSCLSIYLPYVYDRNQNISFDIQKFCKYCASSQLGHFLPIVLQRRHTSFSHIPHSLGAAQKRRGARIERTSSWNKGKATRSWTASAIVHAGSCSGILRMGCRLYDVVDRFVYVTNALWLYKHEQRSSTQLIAVMNQQ